MRNTRTKKLKAAVWFISEMTEEPGKARLLFGNGLNQSRSATVKKSKSRFSCLVQILKFMPKEGISDGKLFNSK